MANASEHNVANPFLLLPSLVRDEIYGYLLPKRNVLWLSRNASDPRPRVDTRIAVGRAMKEFQNAFWRRREVEYQALAHWYPEQTGFPSGLSMLPHMEGYMYGRNGAAVRDILTLRLVCRQVSAEASAILFRRATLWWTLWESEVDFVEGLVRLEDHLAEDGEPGSAQISLPLPERYRRQGIDEQQWSSFVHRKQKDRLLRWVAQFRKINLIIQDSSVTESFRLVQAILRTSRVDFFRSPTLHFIVCGFKIHFNQARNAWEILRKDGKNAAEGLLDTQWSGVPVTNGQNTLNISKISEAGDREFWSCPNSESWLGSHEFCNVSFRADAKFRGADLNIQGKLLFYTPKQPAQ